MRRRPGAFPRAWLVAAVERRRDGTAALARLPEIDPRRWAIVEGEAAAGLPEADLARTPAAGAGEANVVARGPAEVIVDVRATGPALAVLSERMAPGWSVAVDGVPGVYLTTNIVNCPVDEVDIGDRVRVVFEQQDDIYFPLFEKTQ